MRTKVRCRTKWRVALHVYPAWLAPKCHGDGCVTMVIYGVTLQLRASCQLTHRLRPLQIDAAAALHAGRVMPLRRREWWTCAWCESPLGRAISCDGSPSGVERRAGTHAILRHRSSIIHRPQPATGRTRSEPRILLI